MCYIAGLHTNRCSSADEDVKLTKHNVEQMARGYLTYELAKRGYCVQITDSRFPTYDLLVVSPSGKHFGIEVKGQSKKNFWRFNERAPHPEMYYAFVFVPQEGPPAFSSWTAQPP